MVFEERDPRRQNLDSSEQAEIAFTAEQEQLVRSNRKAWAYFQAKPASYRRPATWWVISAKREDTRARRLAQLIEDSAAGRHIKPFIARKGKE